MSEIDLARKLFNNSMFAANGASTSRYRTGSYSQGSTGSVGSNTTTGTTITRKGTVIAVDGNTAEVQLDGSSETIKGYIETPIVVGQRVSAVFDGRTYVFVALSNFVQQTENKFLEIAEDLKETKDEILADVADDIASVNDSVTEAVSKADEAAQKADAASSSVTEITTTVNGLEEEVEGYSTQISGAVETANSALSQATAAQTDLNGFKTTVSQTYSTKTELDDAIEQEVLDRNSAITQSANSIKSEVSETYQVKGDYATSADIDSAIAQEVLDRNSAIEQSASEITSTVSQNYQSKTDAGTMEQELQAQITQNANAIQTEVTNRTQAVSNAISESKSYTDQQADSITQTVETNVMDTVGQTYATKTELEQAEDSITSTVEETVMNEVGETYATKLEVQQTSTQWGIQLEAVEGKADTAQETATTAKNTADTAKSTADTAKGTADTAKETAEGAASAATDAAKTATDYLTYTAAGLSIGNSALDKRILIAPTEVCFYDGSTLDASFGSTTVIGRTSGYNTLIANTGVTFRNGNTDLSYFGSYTRLGSATSKNVRIDSNEIRFNNGSTILASITPNTISLGRNSNGASIDLLNGSATLENYMVNQAPNKFEIYSPYGVRIAAESSSVSGSSMDAQVYVDDTIANLSAGGSYVEANNGATGSIIDIYGNRIKLNNSYWATGCITRSCTADVTVSATNTILPFAQTVTEFDPNNLLYATSNYIRVTKPSGIGTMYVEVSFNVQLNGLLAGQNASAQIYKGTTSSTTACTVQREVLQTPGGGFANLTLPPYLIPCTATNTYFFVKVKCTGGGATIQGGSDYSPYWTVRIIGGK